MKDAEQSRALVTLSERLDGIMQHCNDAAARNRNMVSMSGDFADTDIDGASYALGCLATYVEMRTMVEHVRQEIERVLEES